ncbi:Uncharacterised protein [Bordetella pertussis]|nr:Uncharacterised protein [Bordetella pertussis]
MAAAAVDRDLETIGRRHHRTRIDPHRARLEARPVVQGVDRVAGKRIEEPVVDHRLGAAAPFLRRLEDQYGRAIEIAGLRKILRRPDQHRRVAVMAATMHQARFRRFVPEIVVLGHRQRVHVGTQADHAAAVTCTATDDPHHARLAYPAMHLDAQRFQRAGDNARSTDLLEPQLGVGMQIAPQRRQFVMKQPDGFERGTGVHGQLQVAVPRGTDQ